MYYYQSTPEQFLSIEARAVKQYCLMLNLPCQSYEKPEQLSIRDIESAHLVQGSVPAITQILTRIGIETPSPNYYPVCLSKYIARSISMTTFKHALEMAKTNPLFVKSYNWKAMTGQIITPDNIDECRHQLKPTDKALCSEIVNFVQEFRVYILHDEIIAISRYDENDTDDMTINVDIIIEAANQMRIHHNQVAYVMDWGITDDGQLLLVENNDAWAIGLYKPLAYRQYTTLLQARWQEIVTSNHKKTKKNFISKLLRT